MEILVDRFHLKKDILKKIKNLKDKAITKNLTFLVTPQNLETVNGAKVRI